MKTVPSIVADNSPHTDGVDGLRVEDGVVSGVNQTQAVTVNVHVQVLALEADHKDFQLPKIVSYAKIMHPAQLHCQMLGLHDAKSPKRQLGKIYQGRQSHHI